MVEHKRPVIWSPEALHDIDQLWDYYAEVAGGATADRILRQIGQAVAVIEDFPLAGRVRDEIRSGLRSLAVAPQIVFYRLKDDRADRARARRQAGRRGDFFR